MNKSLLSRLKKAEEKIVKDNDGLMCFVLASSVGRVWDADYQMFENEVGISFYPYLVDDKIADKIKEAADLQKLRNLAEKNGWNLQVFACEVPEEEWDIWQDEINQG